MGEYISFLGYLTLRAKPHKGESVYILEFKSKYQKMCWSFIKRYWTSIFSGAIIIIFLTLPFYILGRELYPVIAAVGGLLFTIPIRLGWQSYMKPVLKFNGVEPISFKPNHTSLQYIAQRIIVENNGRSAAKNCKGYVIYEEGEIERKERVCWTVPKERPNATINPSDNERLDFCAFLDRPSAHTVKPATGGIIVNLSPARDRDWDIIAPTEEKWDILDFRSLAKIKECKVLVTADNTEPVEAKIELDRGNSKIRIL